MYIDISPQDKKIVKADFLSWKPPVVFGNIHVIGNPPFGRQSSMCHKFIKHSANFAETICFVLPATFNKASTVNKVPLNFILIYSKDLGVRSCYGTSARCVFQIWRRTLSERKKEKLIREHPFFSFLPVGDQSADFCVRSVGKCGVIESVVVASKAPNSFHWIRANIEARTLISTLNELDYSSAFNAVSIPNVPQYLLVSLMNQAGWT
jgi:hypothetical protein